ncbi:hypothetical protein WJX73_008969 [Symbiochloris irregularis]|uniref:FACT complex subunit SSRP1 n=1 Tax=Symbiochloris irregularis TaxID=706552 RepID=A0AAW1PYW9_9CHLO
MAEANGHAASPSSSFQFSNVALGTRSGTSEGQLWLSHKGLFWKKLGGGRTIEVPKQELTGLAWSKAPHGGQVAISRSSAPLLQFQNFRDKDADKLEQACKSLDLRWKKEEMSVVGRNWGQASIEGGTLVFTVAGKPAFRIPLKDVGQVQQARDEVNFDFPVDDTGGEREDALVGMSFHVPKDTSQYAGDDDTASNKVFYDAIMEHIDNDTATGDAVVSFDNVTVMAPRGRFTVELYLSSLKLEGQAQDFRIQYDSITRLLVLPKSRTPHTVVVISVDPPIRKGQTFYQHLLAQFDSDEQMEPFELDITDEQLAAKNKDLKHELTREQEGAKYDIFARVLRGLSNSKLAKPGKFRTADGQGYAVRCSYKADEGFLYPLERAFFYIHKPPMLLPHDEIASIEFMRQGGGVLAASAKTFDLSIRLASNDQDHVFRGIQKSEWTNLFNFIQAKKLRIDNLREAEMGPGAAVPQALDLGDDIDTGMAQMQAKGELDDEDEEDEDFDVGGAEAEAAAAEEEAEAASSSGGSDVDAHASPAPKAKKVKRSTEDGASPKQPKVSKKAAKAAAADDEGGAGAKKKRKKKDKNAPKGALSSYMFFGNANREQIKADNPGAPVTEIAKFIGAKWKEATAEDKAPFEEQARQDKERYKEQMAEYKAKLAAEGGGADSD